MLFRRSRIPLDAHEPLFFGICNVMLEYLRFIVLLAAGWINGDQQKIIGGPRMSFTPFFFFNSQCTLKG